MLWNAVNRLGHQLRPPVAAAASTSGRCIPPLHSFLGTSPALKPLHGRRLVSLRRTVGVRGTADHNQSIATRLLAPQARAVQSPPAPSETSETPSDDASALTDLARLNLRRAAVSCRRYGWFGFWSQLVLSVVSTVILMFSAAFTSQNAPAVSVYLTFFGVVLGFLSTFWSWSYTRLSRRLFFYLSSPALDGTKQVKRSEVTSLLERGIIINVLGLGSTLLGLSANVGMLVAKTLTTATANPFLAGQQGVWNPVLALDVFNVQACVNALLAHFISVTCALLMLKIVTDRRAPRTLM